VEYREGDEENGFRKKGYYILLSRKGRKERKRKYKESVSFLQKEIYRKRKYHH
jgi:hypothetical protein